MQRDCQCDEIQKLKDARNTRISRFNGNARVGYDDGNTGVTTVWGNRMYKIQLVLIELQVSKSVMGYT